MTFAGRQCQWRAEENNMSIEAASAVDGAIWCVKAGGVRIGLAALDNASCGGRHVVVEKRISCREVHGMRPCRASSADQLRRLVA